MLPTIALLDLGLLLKPDANASKGLLVINFVILVSINTYHDSTDLRVRMLCFLPNPLYDVTITCQSSRWKRRIFYLVSSSVTPDATFDKIAISC
jgi:hypothetical protein